MKRAIIIYHKNCMDGLASAYITKEALSNSNDKFFYFTDIETLPLQYGEEDYLLDEFELDTNDTIYFVDFSLKRDKMIELSKKVQNINVLDHHKTAQANLKDIEDETENITVIFDMEKCGATICYDYFKQLLPKEFPDRELFEYIEDRDLWKWELELSKEISAGLRWLVDPNDIEKFADIANRYKDEKNKLEYIGKIVTLQQQRQVDSKVKKVKDITIEGINFKCLNATENISEIGNAICTTYNTPALIYFITEKDEVVCSLRSIDTLEDVSVVAKELGGGGHRNACGFTLDIDTFKETIMNQRDRLAELERLIKYWFIANNKSCDDKDKFEIITKGIYKTKTLTVRDFTNYEFEHIITTTGTTTKEMFDKAFEFFKVEKN